MQNGGKKFFSFRFLVFMLLGGFLLGIYGYVSFHYSRLKLEAQFAVVFAGDSSLVREANRELNLVTATDLYDTLTEMEKEREATGLIFEFDEDLEEPEMSMRKLSIEVTKQKYTGYRALFVSPTFPPIIELWCEPGTEKEWIEGFLRESKRMKIEIVKVEERERYYAE